MRRHWKHLSLMKKIDKKGPLELKKIYNHYHENREEIMESTDFKVEGVFGDIIGKDNNSQDEIIKHNNNFLAKMM